MRKVFAIAVAVVALAAGAAYADTLAVTNAAAMGGTTWGMVITHDNADVAYVQDNSATAETIYRGDFLLNAVSVTGQTINFRQELMRVIGPVPNPSVGLCPPSGSIGAIRVWLYQTGGAGQNSNVQLWAKGNQCGEAGTTRFAINNNQDYRVCWEWQGGSPGLLALYVGSPASPCPVSGDAAWASNTQANALVTIETVRLGAPSTNTYGAGETATWYMDEFASFRTLTP